MPVKKTKKAPKAKATKAEKKDARSLTEKMRDHLRLTMKDETAADTFAGDGLSSVREVMPTRLDVLDHGLIGIGGLPYGRIIEISGAEDTGKSSLVNHLIWAAQQDGAVASLGDAERKVQPNWVDVFKVERKAVLLLPARTVEEYLQELAVTIKKYKRTKIVFFLDSVATTQPQKALDEDLTDNEIPGAMAAAWSRGLRSLNPLLSESRSMLVLVNQVRSVIGNMYGPTENTAAGRALKYYLSLRLSMYHGQTLKDGKVPIGKWSKLSVGKNHLSQKQPAVSILLRYTSGWDNDRSTLMYAREVGAITRTDRSVKTARQCLGWPVNESDPDVLVDELPVAAPAEAKGKE